MSTRGILGVLCSSCHEPNAKSLEDILVEAPECFNGFLCTSEGHISYIFNPEESTVKIFTDSVSQPFYRAEPEPFSLALRMREWLKIRLALCQMERALSASRLPGYALEEQVCGRQDLMALRVTSMGYTPDSRVTILACEQFDRSNATKTVSPYVSSKACKDVNFFQIMFSFKWRDYHIFRTLMNKLDSLFENREQLRRWPRLSLRHTPEQHRLSLRHTPEEQQVRRRIFPWQESGQSFDGARKRLCDGELETDNVQG